MNVKQLNRSFARRIGKGLSQHKKELLQNHLDTYLFNSKNLNNNAQYSLEIGFGMGDHLIHQAKSNPHHIFIGADPYLNGVVNVLKAILKNNINNILLWNNDIDLIMHDLPKLENIYILFPDPWPKRRHQKRYFINEERLKILFNKLNQNFYFITDDELYFKHCQNLLPQFGTITNNLPENYQPTKYHQKALSEKKEIFIISSTTAS